MRLYLSVRYDSPMAVGGLKTSDPPDPAVRAWWRGKAAEIYRHIPDLGGFLVKGDSEGQPYCFFACPRTLIRSRISTARLASSVRRNSQRAAASACNFL